MLSVESFRNKIWILFGEKGLYLQTILDFLWEYWLALYILDSPSFNVLLADFFK